MIDLISVCMPTVSESARGMAARLQLQVPACRLLEQSCGSESKDLAKKNADYHMLLNAFIGIKVFLHLLLPYMEVTHSHLPSFMILVFYLKAM
jgi:hypothetical protein